MTQPLLWLLLQTPHPPSGSCLGCPPPALTADSPFPWPLCGGLLSLNSVAFQASFLGQMGTPWSNLCHTGPGDTPGNYILLHSLPNHAEVNAKPATPRVVSANLEGQALQSSKDEVFRNPPPFLHLLHKPCLGWNQNKGD